MTKKEESKLRLKQKEKIKSELQSKKEKLIYSVKLQYEKLIFNQTEKIKAKYQKKLDRRLARIERIYKTRESKQIQKKVYNREVKVKDDTDKRKQKAFEEIQRYAKLSRMDSKGIVYQVDTKQYIYWNKCQGGHIYPKHNYPQLAFDIRNIWPISSWGNKKQADNIGDWIDNTTLTEQDKLELKTIANDKNLKNIIQNSAFYIEIYEKYLKLNNLELQRLTDNQSISRNT